MKKVIIAITILLLLSQSLFAGTPVVGLQKGCVPGIHQQPNGPFAIYVFCDDALGTNIAILFNDLGAPLQGPYTLTKRFWQSDDWGADVTSYSWLPDGNRLLISTSAIYGTGKLYLLQLREQMVNVIYVPPQDTCLIEILEVEIGKIKLRVTDCELKERIIETAI